MKTMHECKQGHDPTRCPPKYAVLLCGDTRPANEMRLKFLFVIFLGLVFLMSIFFLRKYFFVFLKQLSVCCGKRVCFKRKGPFFPRGAM